MGSQKQTMHGHTGQAQNRYPSKAQQAMFSILNRALLGQLVNPPNTAITTPLGQGATMLQQGGTFGGAADTAAKMAADPSYGAQTREQLGLPDRRSYFTFLPTAEQVAALGAVPGIQTSPGTQKAMDQLDKLQARADQAAQAGQTGKAAKIEKRITKMRGQHPELGG